MNYMALLQQKPERGHEKMKLIIEGGPKEIADLVLAVQNQPVEKECYSPVSSSKNIVTLDEKFDGICYEKVIPKITEAFQSLFLEMVKNRIYQPDIVNKKAVQMSNLTQQVIHSNDEVIQGILERKASGIK